MLRFPPELFLDKEYEYLRNRINKELPHGVFFDGYRCNIHDEVLNLYKKEICLMVFIDSDRAEQSYIDFISKDYFITEDDLILIKNQANLNAQRIRNRFSIFL